MKGPRRINTEKEIDLFLRLGMAINKSVPIFSMVTLLLTVVTTVFAGNQSVKPSSIFADLDSCRFTMDNLYDGVYEIDKEEVPVLFFYSKVIKPKARRPLEINLKFRCVSPASLKDISDFSGGKITENGWVISLDPDVASGTKMYNTFYLLKGKNWEGPGISQDVTNGEEEGRTRRFGFCIPHGSAALCGGGDVAYLNDLKGSALREVIKMIETIEFVE